MEKMIIKTSRISFILIYAFSLLLIFLFFFFGFNEISVYVNWLFVLIISSIASYPEWYVFYYTFMIDKDRVIEVTGFLDKKKLVIPITSVAHVTLNKTLLGRILNYGDVNVTAFGDTKILFRGIRNPDDFVIKLEVMMEKYRHIEEKK